LPESVKEAGFKDHEMFFFNNDGKPEKIKGYQLFDIDKDQYEQFEEEHRKRVMDLLFGK
jgi:hypothetical protein